MMLFVGVLMEAPSGRLNGAPPRLQSQGKVLDATGAPIAGARVIATTLVSAFNTSTASGPDGAFTLSIQPGSYKVHVAADGFQAFDKVVNFTSTSAPLEIVLQVAPKTETVTVNETVSYQVVTSNSFKVPTPLHDIPQSISVVPRELMRDQAMQNMADVVRYVPGITMAQGEGHRDAPVIRGNITTADFYVNGVRDDVQYYRDLYNVERVEAVKGANALTFGRGGGGGVINRVTKEATFAPIREITLQGGTFNNKRIATDFGHSFGEKLAFRLNGMYENSDSFRHDVNLERYGVAPTLTYMPGESTRIKVSYEYFIDNRTVDRGIPSLNGAPSPANRSTFFGDPRVNHAFADVHIGAVTLDHQFGAINLRNNTLFSGYDKFYQNILPGNVDIGRGLVSLSGYNSPAQRRNIFNQTDVTGVLTTGRIRHTILMGSEFGRQHTDNFRNTAYFGNATSINVPFWSPNVRTNAVFRQSATDADNFATNHVAAVYVQDQVELSRYLQVVGGVRYDNFDIDFHNNRNGENLTRSDNLVSPRAGIVLKPFSPLSLYASYSVTYLPSSGDQFSSLTATTQTLKPEKFSNYEIGAKFDVARYLSFTAAAYKLDRTNTTARDPNDPARTVQTGKQRTDGYELGVNGNILRKWRIIGGYANQDAYVTSATLAAARGAKVALVPRHSFSLWNNYSVTSRWGMGLGIIYQSNMFAGIDNKVTLPKFTRADLATYYALTEMIRLQANVENLFDRTYYPTAHSNNNISPGYARAVRIGLIARF